MKRIGELLAGVGLAPRVIDMQANLQATIDRYRAYNLPPEFFQVLALEQRGGPCPRCGKPWERIDAEGLYVYHYFTPECDCYPRCPECGTSWHREAAAGFDRFEKCNSCRWTAHPVYVRICRRCEESFRTGRSDDHLCAACEERAARTSKRTA